jgi:hypothetical protein
MLSAEIRWQALSASCVGSNEATQKASRQRPPKGCGRATEQTSADWNSINAVPLNWPLAFSRNRMDKGVPAPQTLCTTSPIICLGARGSGRERAGGSGRAGAGGVRRRSHDGLTIRSKRESLLQLKGKFLTAIWREGGVLASYTRGFRPTPGGATEREGCITLLDGATPRRAVLLPDD